MLNHATWGKKTKTKTWVVWDLSLEIIYYIIKVRLRSCNYTKWLLLLISKKQICFKLLLNLATSVKQKNKNMGCVGFKFKKFWE